MRVRVPAWFFGLTYVAAIPLFALVFWRIGSNFSEKLSLIDAHYLSAVTITTLGYGDIVPDTEVARALTAMEAVSGIVLIGLFLNALSREWAIRAAKDEKKLIEYDYEKKQVAKLIGHWSIVELHYWRFLYSVYALTTPIAERDKDITEPDLIEHLNSKYPFSNLRDIFIPPLLTSESSSKTSVELFIEVDRKISGEFQMMLRDVDFAKVPGMVNLLQSYLGKGSSLDFYEPILEMAIWHRTDREHAVVKLVEKMIAENDKLPVLDHPNVIQPYVWLYNILRMKGLVFISLRNAVKALDSENPYPELVIQASKKG